MPPHEPGSTVREFQELCDLLCDAARARARMKAKLEAIRSLTLHEPADPSLAMQQASGVPSIPAVEDSGPATRHPVAGI